MAPRTPAQRLLQQRIEQGIRLAAPALDLVLAVGDRISRVAGRHDLDPEPPRRPRERAGTPPHR